MKSTVGKISLAVGALVALQLGNFLFVQPHYAVQCTDRAGATHTFRLTRDFLSFGGRCQVSDLPPDADCRRELERMGAEGGMCARDGG